MSPPLWRAANFCILHRASDHVLIMDQGPWDQHPTVTNDAEGVVARLFQFGHLKAGQRLFYYDSENSLDEIVIKDRKFHSFAPGPSKAIFEDNKKTA